MKADAEGSRWPWLAAIERPHQVLGWNLAQWETAIRQTRRLRLLSRLAESIDALGLLGQVPELPARHLTAGLRTSRYRTMLTRWTASRVAAALHDIDVPLIALKGAAYMAQGLTIAQGRLPSDLDILVPRTRLPEVAALLQQAGWAEVALDERDRAYYSEWTHEMPPMRHPVLEVELDLHHHVIPPMKGLEFNADRLFDRALPSTWPRWQVLAPEDQVLHSAAHLFFDAEPIERIRDLLDLDGLLRHFGGLDATFGDRLARRGVELGLTEPLALACHFCHKWFDTPLPAALATAGAIASTGRHRRLCALFAHLLAPAELDAPRPLGQRLAATALLARYHWRRMPLPVLVPHLLRKAMQRRPAAAGPKA